MCPNPEPIEAARDPPKIGDQTNEMEENNIPINVREERGNKILVSFIKDIYFVARAYWVG